MEHKSAQDIERSTQKLLEDLRAVVRDGEELLKAGAEGLSEQGKIARERLGAALETAKETGRKLQEQMVSGAKVADRYIRENPYQSIGVAFGVGMLLGVLLYRK